jgi:hypothetical protein
MEAGGQHKLDKRRTKKSPHCNCVLPVEMYACKYDSLISSSCTRRKTELFLLLLRPTFCYGLVCGINADDYYSCGPNSSKTNIPYWRFSASFPNQPHFPYFIASLLAPILFLFALHRRPSPSSRSYFPVCQL